MNTPVLNKWNNASWYEGNPRSCIERPRFSSKGDNSGGTTDY